TRKRRYVGTARRRVESAGSVLVFGTRWKNGHLGRDLSTVEFRSIQKVSRDRINLRGTARLVRAENFRLECATAHRTRLHCCADRWYGHGEPFESISRSRLSEPR